MFKCLIFRFNNCICNFFFDFLGENYLSNTKFVATTTYLKYRPQVSQKRVLLEILWDKYNDDCTV